MLRSKYELPTPGIERRDGLVQQGYPCTRSRVADVPINLLCIKEGPEDCSQNVRCQLSSSMMIRKVSVRRVSDYYHSMSVATTELRV